LSWLELTGEQRPGENIFVVREGLISTPPLSTSILPGITRDTVIKIAAHLGHQVTEQPLIRPDLLADEIFFTGTAAEVTPVRAVDGHELGVGELTRQIQEAYLDTVRGRRDFGNAWLDHVQPTAWLDHVQPTARTGSR
jgi:branched-chain amino acid aminotransferase